MITTVKSGNTNCYILSNENMDRYVLVDAGTTQDKYFIEKLKLTGKLTKIGLLILTHGHYDHVGYASILQKEFNIPVTIHLNDIEKVRHSSMDFPPAKGVLSGIIRKLTIKNIKAATYPNLEPDIILGSQLNLEDFPEIKILYLPGHTKGSIGIVFENNLLVGDLIMNMPFPSTTWFAEDFSMVRESIHSIYQSPFIRIYPGHGSSFSGKLLKNLTY